MSRPTTTRKAGRQEVLRLLDPTSWPRVNTVTADSDSLSVLTDSALSPASQDNDYVGLWIYISTQPIAVDSETNINESGQFTASDTTLTVGDNTKFTVGDGIQFSATATATGEICRVTAVDGGGADLTIVRGIQGTTATTHEDADNVFIIGPAIGEVVRVVNTAFTGSTSNLLFEPDLSASLISGQEYEAHRKVHSKVINERLDFYLDQLQQQVVLPISLLTDGDMETSGTGSWTAVGTGGTPTLAKDTSTVRRGRQSLSITNDGSTTIGYAKSASVYMPSGTVCVVSADVYITPGDLARLTFYDVTNSAVIGTAMESDESGWVHLENTFTVPATCEEVQVWAESQAVSDVTYWDSIVLWKTQELQFELPTFLQYAHDVRSVFYFPLNQKLSGSTNVEAYTLGEKEPVFFSHITNETDDSGVVPARYFLSKRSGFPLWIKAKRKYGAYSGSTEEALDTDTTTLPEDLLTITVAASIFDDLADEALDKEKFQLFERLAARAEQLRGSIVYKERLMNPPKTKISGPFNR